MKLTENQEVAAKKKIVPKLPYDERYEEQKKKWLSGAFVYMVRKC